MTIINKTAIYKSLNKEDIIIANNNVSNNIEKNKIFNQ